LVPFEIAFLVQWQLIFYMLKIGIFGVGFCISGCVTKLIDSSCVDIFNCGWNCLRWLCVQMLTRLKLFTVICLWRNLILYIQQLRFWCKFEYYMSRLPKNRIWIFLELWPNEDVKFNSFDYAFPIYDTLLNKVSAQSVSDIFIRP